MAESYEFDTGAPRVVPTPPKRPPGSISVPVPTIEIPAGTGDDLVIELKVTPQVAKQLGEYGAKHGGFVIRIAPDVGLGD